MLSEKKLCASLSMHSRSQRSACWPFGLKPFALVNVLFKWHRDLVTGLKTLPAANRLQYGWKKRKPLSTENDVQLLKTTGLFLQEERGMSLSELSLKVAGREGMAEPSAEQRLCALEGPAHHREIAILASEEQTNQTKVCTVDFQRSPLERTSCCLDDVVAGVGSAMRSLVGQCDVAGDDVDWCEPHPFEMKVVLPLLITNNLGSDDNFIAGSFRVCWRE